MIATSLYFTKPFSFTRNLVYTSYILIISCIYKFVNSAFFFPEIKCCRCFMGWENTIQALIEEARGRLLDMLMLGQGIEKLWQDRGIT